MISVRKIAEGTDERIAGKIVRWIGVRIGGKIDGRAGEKIGGWIGKRIVETINDRTQAVSSVDWIGPTMWPVSAVGKDARMPA